MAFGSSRQAPVALGSPSSASGASVPVLWGEGADGVRALETTSTASWARCRRRGIFFSFEWGSVPRRDHGSQPVLLSFEGARRFVRPSFGGSSAVPAGGHRAP